MPPSAPQSGNPESRSPPKGSRRFFLTLPSGFTPGGGVGTAFPLDPPLDRQGGTGPGVGARCRRPSEVKGGGRRDGRAESRPHRCPRGILGARGLEREAPHCLGCEARGEQVLYPLILWEAAAPHARRLHTLKSHDAGTSQATTQLFPGVFQHPIFQYLGSCGRIVVTQHPRLDLGPPRTALPPAAPPRRRTVLLVCY